MTEHVSGSYSLGYSFSFPITTSTPPTKHYFDSSERDVVGTLEGLIKVASPQRPKMIFLASPRENRSSDIQIDIISYVSMEALSPELKTAIRKELGLK